MLRDLKKQKQSLDYAGCEEILNHGTSGVLALRGDDDYPYAVPLSYVYSEGSIYFRGAKEGHKVDAVKKYDKASFCVIAKDEIIPGEYRSLYGSVIAFGKIHIVDNEEEKKAALKALSLHYVPEKTGEETDLLIEKVVDSFVVMKLDIEKLTGKVASEDAK